MPELSTDVTVMNKHDQTTFLFIPTGALNVRRRDKIAVRLLDIDISDPASLAHVPELVGVKTEGGEGKSVHDVKLVKGPFRDLEMLSLRRCSADIEISLCPNFQSIRKLRLRVIHVLLYYTCCISHYVVYFHVDIINNQFRRLFPNTN